VGGRAEYEGQPKWKSCMSARKSVFRGGRGKVQERKDNRWGKADRSKKGGSLVKETAFLDVRETR